MVFAALSTMTLPVTATYLGASGVLLAYLALGPGLYRVSSGIMYGFESGKGKLDNTLIHLSRAHGNLQEVFGPFFLLFGLVEANKILSVQQLQVLGAVWLALRVGHALQLRNPTKLPVAVRGVGYLGTTFLLAVMSALLLYHGVTSKTGFFN